MRAIKAAVVFLFFMAVFLLSLAVSSRYFNEKVYYGVSVELFQYQDDLESSLIIDFQEMINSVDSREVGSSIKIFDVCGPEFNH